MKVMMIGDYSGLGKALSARPEVQFYRLCHPPSVADVRREENVAGAFPYQARAKLDPRAILQVRTAIRQTRPDLVHAMTGRPLASAVLATTGMKRPPKIVSFRGITTKPSRADPANWITFLHRRVAGHACESEAVRQALIEGGVRPEKCVTTYGCVTIGTLPRPGRSALAPWGIPADAFVVGSVATIRRVKGMDLLLRAAGQCADLQDVYWLLIGPVRDRRVARLARNSPVRERLRLLGFRPDAAALVSGVDLFVMPSRREALCRALLEAMAQRLCPVVSDAGGMKEVVRNGIEGVVFPREDVRALAGAIRSLHADRQQAKSFADASLRRATELLSPEKMADRTMELYRRVLADAPVPARAAHCQ